MIRRSVPEPVTDELPRPHLVQRLQERFRSRVVCVVAGAGFGKSTAVAQAARANQVHPLGLEVWLGCRPGDEDADRLGRALLDLLGAPLPAETDATGDVAVLAAAVERAITQMSPLDLDIVVDDLHLIPPGSSSERLLAEILRRLPDNGHLTLVSRTAPTIPLARLRAAGDVVDLTEADLAFSAGEVGALARSLGRSADAVTGLGGWPALVRLGLVAPVGADRDFLVEEVLGTLTDEARTTLLALALVGPADDATVGRVTGRPAVLADLLRRVPLVSRSADGRYSAHQLWDDALRTSVAPSVAASLQLRSIDVLLAGGQFARAGQIAIATGDASILDRVALALLRTSVNHIPVDTVRPWLRALPDPGPGVKVLEALVRFALDAKDPCADQLADEVIELARRTGHFDLEAAALAAAAVMAHARQDLGRLFPLAMRATELEPTGDPVLHLLRAAIPAIGADLRGDPEAVIEALHDLPWARLPIGGTRLVGRLHLQALWMAGRAGESVAFADRWYRSTESYLAGLSAIARWFAGEPADAFTGGIAMARDTRTNERDLFVGQCFMTVIGACQGRRADVEAVWADGTIASLGFDNARDSAHLAYATAARRVLAGDEAGAAAAYRRHLADHPLRADDALGERHLRRFPALGYVLSDELRAAWSVAALGPEHRRAVASAQALLDVRAGRRPGELPPAPALVTHLPLPWTIELLAGMANHADPRADVWWDGVHAVVGDRALDELARRAAPGAAHLPGAAVLRDRLPEQPRVVTEIRVLGPVEVLHGGHPSEAPELRRQRVRQLLGLLVLERHVTRERAQDLLWPDLATDAASKNLRVTLTHLRKVLEPERSAGTPGFHLRVDHTTIALRASPHLRVDAWEADRWARRADDEVDLAAEHDALTHLVALWRGAPLSDLDDVTDVAGTIEGIRQRHVDTLLRLGERRIASGAPADAKRLAADALSVDPYREQAHRLAIAADLRLDDAAELRRSVARLGEAMDELGVPVGPSTQVLLHQVATRAEARSALRG